VLARISSQPTHTLFALLFVPAAAVIAAATGGALGAMRGRHASAVVALAGGATASLAFLAVDTLVEYLGASATTMQTLALDDLGAALAASVVIALLLTRFSALSAQGSGIRGHGSGVNALG
jgi:hypothetical protein